MHYLQAPSSAIFNAFNRESFQAKASSFLAACSESQDCMITASVLAAGLTIGVAPYGVIGACAYAFGRAVYIRGYEDGWCTSSKVAFSQEFLSKRNRSLYRENVALKEEKDEANNQILKLQGKVLAKDAIFKACERHALKI